jgi:hypothetical protein
MGNKSKPKHRKEDNASPFDKARDELLSHILHCGVLQAEPQHQKDWFDDTMEYMAERYATLSDNQLATIRTLGERYCKPVKAHTEVGATS